ncbi:MAG: DEAD/DEAH box helicase [Acidobacteria bacterium]|nr:DEAD/DEAH box helicase [Acidobacteriota bacterium]MCH8985879.1 DEAD/DEAH box helicase [Acidobacteriota bacterium]
MTILTQFSSATGGWFKQSFPSATPAQTKGWEAIQRGEHTLIHAPTGSGKTLAAFLSAIDKLTLVPRPTTRPPRHTPHAGATRYCTREHPP